MASARVAGSKSQQRAPYPVPRAGSHARPPRARSKQKHALRAGAILNMATQNGGSAAVRRKRPLQPEPGTPMWAERAPVDVMCDFCAYPFTDVRPPSAVKLRSRAQTLASQLAWLCAAVARDLPPCTARPREAHRAAVGCACVRALTRAVSPAQPVSLYGCGHVFCRSCALAELAHTPKCPKAGCPNRPSLPGGCVPPAPRCAVAIAR